MCHHVASRANIKVVRCRVATRARQKLLVDDLVAPAAGSANDCQNGTHRLTPLDDFRERDCVRARWASASLRATGGALVRRGFHSFEGLVASLFFCLRRFLAFPFTRGLLVIARRDDLKVGRQDVIVVYRRAASFELMRK